MFKVKTKHFSGVIVYFLNGEYHREDGPALDCSRGYSRFYLKNVEYSYSHWRDIIREQEKVKERLILQNKISAIEREKSVLQDPEMTQK